MTVSASRFKNTAELFVDIGAKLHAASAPDEVFSLISINAVQACPGAEFASVSRGEHGGFRTVGSTGDVPLRVDAIQYELLSGPCVDAVLESCLIRTDDLRTDARWPEFARRTVAETGVLSMLAFRMFFETSEIIAGLNLYSRKPGAFTEDDEAAALLLATHGAQVLSSVRWQSEAESLEQALASNRDIGVAMGILMGRHLLTRDEAFGLLRMASQHRHRKLAAIALEVVETGELELPAPQTRDR